MTKKMLKKLIFNYNIKYFFKSSYEKAATLIEPMLEAYDQNPDVLLLRAHIYFGLQKYETACQDYESVLKLTDRQDLIDLAQQSLVQAQQMLGQSIGANSHQAENQEIDLAQSPFDTKDDGEEDWDMDFQIDDQLDWNFDEDDFGEPTIGHNLSASNPFDDEGQTTFSPPQTDSSPLNEAANPFDDEQPSENPDTWQEPLAMADFPFEEEEDSDLKTEAHRTNNAGKNTFLVSPKLDSPELKDLGDLAQESFVPQTPRDEFSNNSQNESTIEVNNKLDEDNSFLDNIDRDLSQLDLSDLGGELPDSDIFTRTAENFNENLGLGSSELINTTPTPTTVSWVKPNETTNVESGVESKTTVKPTVEVTQKTWSSWFVNASLKYKPLITAGSTGLISFLAILLVGSFTSLSTPKPEAETSPANKTEQVTPKPEDKQKPSDQPPSQSSKSESVAKSSSPIFLIALVGGLSSFSISLLFSWITCGQVKKTIDDLQAQFDAMYAGDFNVKATIHSSDELGQLSLSFNQLARTILTTTSEAQQRAAETEQAQEDLTRQVIRLLDDVEGAARGDLTVEAVVTADVLGAVADAFNLTIQNLREIVGQVKQAAKQVNKGSTDSESFARNNSSDALRMAEELAVTLNSVQVMTESIQRVAENAREAEEVAHNSSLTALKGGEAVERTVAGILGIRETVSDTTRKVKRLAEASQEISKIVALISQIASRTNLLALNASIQAARAGEAGRGFAIVADEVRQLADRSAKSLKEIEQIVLQIQSETGSVMTAMEEGIQQVINLVDTSEQAKRSLEDIIEVSNRINSLVRSITADTVKQRENSRAVTQVMQSVELTAQEASQESQRVAGSLQNLVSISRDLLTSVEKFRVDKSENRIL